MSALQLNNNAPQSSSQETLLRKQNAKIKIYKQSLGYNISRKAGQKCCPYGQNGKPLSQEKVETFLQQYKDKQWWHTNEDRTSLTRSFYLKNIFCAVEFLKDVYEMDSMTTQQIPNVHILEQGDILKVELHTKPLKGLSFRDLELATIIDSFDFDKYMLVPIAGERDVRRAIRKIKVDEQIALFCSCQVQMEAHAKAKWEFYLRENPKIIGNNEIPKSTCAIF